MNKHEKDSIRKYNRIASSYDKSLEGRFTKKPKKKMLSLCGLPNGGKVLDVGCGNGSLINAISQKSTVSAYGTDITPNMIEECRKNYPQIDFTVSSGEKLMYEDNFFDMITICYVLHHLNNPMKFFEEAQRTIKRGGSLIVGELWYPAPIRQFFDYIIFPLLKAGDNKVFTHKRLKSLFTEHGFVITEIYKKGFIQIVKGRKI